MRVNFTIPRVRVLLFVGVIIEAWYLHPWIATNSMDSRKVVR
jgi:hypothetical protein